MKRVVYVYSTKPNGALAKSFFKKSFEVEGLRAPPKVGSIVPPLHGGLKQGVITDVKYKPTKVVKVWVATETPLWALRDCLIPDGWEEVNSHQE